MRLNRHAIFLNNSEINVCCLTDQNPHKDNISLPSNPNDRIRTGIPFSTEIYFEDRHVITGNQRSIIKFKNKNISHCDLLKSICHQQMMFRHTKSV